jgi:hypothetical protein
MFAARACRFPFAISPQTPFYRNSSAGIANEHNQPKTAATLQKKIFAAPRERETASEIAQPCRTDAALAKLNEINRQNTWQAVMLSFEHN